MEMPLRKREVIYRIPDENGCRRLPEPLPSGAWISYILFLRLAEPVGLEIGRLGRCTFPAGEYGYFGSARKNLAARINRHLRRRKKRHWHIDYLLADPVAEITRVVISTRPECELVREWGGKVIIPGFGASDCRAGCDSHLRCFPCPFPGSE